MNNKGTLFVLWAVVAVVIACLLTHFSHHLLFVLENCLAVALPG